MRSVREILEETERIAVVGATVEGERASTQVGVYLRIQGYDLAAVNPLLNRETIWGKRAAAGLGELEQPVELVLIFPRSGFVGTLVDALLALDWAPRTVWLQLGIEDEVAEARLRDAGIEVVAGRNIVAEHQLWGIAPRAERMVDEANSRALRLKPAQRSLDRG